MQMAKKKAKVTAKPVVDAPALPALTQEEMLRLRLFDAEAKLAQQEARSCVMERQALLAKIDPNGLLLAIDTKRQGVLEQERAVRQKYREALAAASSRIGIDLSNGCAIDPETGTIIQHEAKKEQ